MSWGGEKRRKEEFWGLKSSLSETRGRLCKYLKDITVMNHGKQKMNWIWGLLIQPLIDKEHKRKMIRARSQVKLELELAEESKWIGRISSNCRRTEKERNGFWWKTEPIQFNRLREITPKTVERVGITKERGEIRAKLQLIRRVKVTGYRIWKRYIRRKQRSWRTHRQLEGIERRDPGASKREGRDIC